MRWRYDANGDKQISKARRGHQAEVLPVHVLRRGQGLGGQGAPARGEWREMRGDFPTTLKLKLATIDVDGKQIKLAPGMNITADIKTGKRRVIEYLLGPIQMAGARV